MEKGKVRVTRFDGNGKVFHRVISEQPIEIVMMEPNNVIGNVIGIAMPYRWWLMCSGGRLEIEAC